MRCLCPSDTLRLFIRSVTRLDISVSSFPSFSNPHEVAGRLPSTRRLYTRCMLPRRTAALPRTSTYREDLRRNSIAALPRQLQTTSQQWQQAPAPSAEIRTSSPRHGAVLELSIQNIDSLISELEGQKDVTPTNRSTGRRSISKELAHDKPVGPKIRRSRVQNTELAIHYSSPRAPLRSPPPRDIKSAPKPPQRVPKDSGTQAREAWQTQKDALQKKFPDGWMPQKRLSPDALAGIRALHAQEPEKYTTKLLAESFEISPEAIRRILKSKWVPDPEEESERTRRWIKRGQEVWSRKAELGLKPPRMWREMGIGSRKPEWKKDNKPQHIMPPLITTSRRTGAVKPGES